jgi:hypothetical protein
MAKESLSVLKERALAFVLKHYSAYSDRKDLEDKWGRFDRLFNSLPEKKNALAANLFPPEINRALLSLLNFCDEALWNKQPNFKLLGVGGAEDQKRAELNEKLLRLQQNKINYRSKLRKAIQNEIKYGFCVCKVPYVFENKHLVKRQKSKNFFDMLKEFLSGESKAFEKDIITAYDNIDFIPLNPFYVFWDYFKKWEDQTCIIEIKDNLSKSDLLKLAKNNPQSYFDIENILKDEFDAGTDSKDKDQLYPHLNILTGLNYKSIASGKTHTIFEAWCSFDIDDDGIDEECVICVLDEKHIIRIELNPYAAQEKPFLFCAWEDIDGAESLGIGIVQKAERSQLALNDFVNSFMDNINLILDCMWVVDRLSNINKGQLKARPRGVIESDTGINGIQALRPPNVIPAANAGIAMTKEDIRQSTGATVSLQGMPARYDTTATEANTMMNASQRDVFTKLRAIEDNLIKPFLKRAYGYNLQYMSRLDLNKILGAQAMTAYLRSSGKDYDDTAETEQILKGDYDIEVVGITEIENKIIKGQQIMNLYNLALKSPPGIWNVKNMAKLIVKYAADGDGSILADDIEQIFINPNDENVLISQGEKPAAKNGEDHEAHIRTHIAAPAPGGFENIKEEHIKQHLRLLDLDRQRKAQILQQQTAAQQAALLKRGEGERAAESQLSEGDAHGVSAEQQPVFAPKGLTVEQIGQVPGVVNAPPSLL